MNFHKSLTLIRRTDAALAEAVRPIAAHVLEQWHKHSNKTPYMELQLAIHGGVDSHGLFGKKGDTIRGVSKGIAMAFAGIKLGKADPTADIPALVDAATAAGMATRAEAKEAAAKRRAEREAKAGAKPEEPTPEAVTNGLIVNGAAVVLTSQEAAMLLTTLEHIRRARTVDNVVAGVDDVAHNNLLIAG